MLQSLGLSRHDTVDKLNAMLTMWMNTDDHERLCFDKQPSNAEQKQKDNIHDGVRNGGNSFNCNNNPRKRGADNTVATLDQVARAKNAGNRRKSSTSCSTNNSHSTPNSTHTMGDCYLLSETFSSATQKKPRKGDDDDKTTKDKDNDDGFPEIHNVQVIFGGLAISETLRHRKNARHEVFTTEHVIQRPSNGHTSQSLSL